MDIKDSSLAPSGHKKIDWVSAYMPVLSSIAEDFKKARPFTGLRVAMSIHLEAKTAYLATVLAAGGAEVYATGCNPLSTQDDVAAALAERGVKVFARHGVSAEEYEEHLLAVLSCHPHLMIDDGGDLTSLLHGKAEAYGDCLIGGAEETTTGIHRLLAREAQGGLRFPMVDVNDADCKHLFDNRYGTGQSTFDGIMNTTNLIIAGKTVVIAGYGWCGKGAAMRAKGLGAKVIVTEIDPVKAIEAAMDGFDVCPMEEAAPRGDLFITLTGCRDVIRAEHFDVEIDKIALEKAAVRVYERKPNIMGYEMPDGRVLNLLAEGRLVNLAAGNGHPAEIMDMSFAIQAKSLEFLLLNKETLTPRVYRVPAEIDREVAARKLLGMGLAIDTLSPEQEAYLAACE